MYIEKESFNSNVNTQFYFMIGILHVKYKDHNTCNNICKQHITVKRNLLYK